MKKFVSLFLSLALLLAFCGCTSKSPDTTDKADNISIKFVIDSSTAYNNEAIDPDLKSKLPNDGLIYSSEKLTVSEGCSVGSALALVCKVHSIALNSENGSYGLFVKGICGIENGAFGDASYWLLRVNGKFPEVGADSVILNDGDLVEWIYTVDGGEDIGADFGG